MRPIVERLDKDLRVAARAMSREEARMLVDTRLQMQKDRIRARARLRATGDLKAARSLEWLGNQFELLERRVDLLLGLYVEQHEIGPWLSRVRGVGDILAAGLITAIDIEKCETAGDIYAFAGVPCVGQVWEKGRRRPWNAALRRLCYNIGESFVNVSGNPDAYYGQIYRARKEYEWKRNLTGELADRAQERLKVFRGTNESWRKWYEGAYSGIIITATRAGDEFFRAGFDAQHLDGLTEALFLKVRSADKEEKKLEGVLPEPLWRPGVPMLSPDHIHRRAKWFAITIFLSHLFTVWYRVHFQKEPPKPFPERVLGHVHILPPPDFAAEGA